MCKEAYTNIDHIVSHIGFQHSLGPVGLHSFVIRTMLFIRLNGDSTKFMGKVRHRGVDFYTGPMDEATMNFIKVLAVLERESIDEDG